MNDRELSRQQGQSIILVAAALVALVLFVAITVDMSAAYYHRRTAQNAADGAALAGVAQMAEGINNQKKLDGLVQKAMNDFAERNGIEDTGGILADADNNNVDGWYVDPDGLRLTGEPMVGAGTVPVGSYGVEAITYITAPTFFGGIFGLSGLPLNARAVSVLREVCAQDCVVPIGMEQTSLCGDNPNKCKERIGKCVNVWDGTGPGNYGWLNWSWQELTCVPFNRPCPIEQGGTNACDPNTLADNLDPANCSSGFIAVNDWVSGATGVMNDKDVLGWLDYYLGLTDGISHTFTIIIYDFTSEIEPYNTTSLCNAMQPSDSFPPGENWPSAGLHYHVAGFGVMQIMGYQLSQGQGVVSVGHDGTGCEDLGVKPEKEGFRITAEYREWVTEWNANSACYDPLGTLLSAPKLKE